MIGGYGAAVLGPGHTCLVAALVAVVAPAATSAAPPARTEALVRSHARDRRLVRESYVSLLAPLSAQFGAHPAACDRIGYLRYRSTKGPSRFTRADAILVAMPGIFAGSGSLDQTARNVVRRARARGRSIEFWALDRRSNCLEDHWGIDLGARDKSTQPALDYYFKGKAIGGRRFAGFVSEQDAAWESHLGLAQTLRDEMTVIAQVPPALRTRKVLCGGHSLGGTLTGEFAGWDFDGDPKTTADAGYEQCAGFFALDTRLPSGGGGGGGGGPSLVGAAGSASPYVDAPPFTPETIQAVPITGLGSFFSGDRESNLARELPDDPNFELTFRTLFSRDAVNFATGQPDYRDFRITGDVALGAVFDDNSSPIDILRASLGTWDGGPVAEKNFPLPYGSPSAGLFGGGRLMVPTTPKGPLYTWRNYDRVGVGEPPQLDSSGQPFTTRGSEITDIHDFARGLFDAPADFAEQYFPTRLASESASAGSGDRSGDLQNLRYDGVAKRPSLYLDAGEGIQAGAAAPAKGPGPSARYVLPGYNHIDVGTAAWRQNDGRPEPVSLRLVDFTLDIVPAAPARRHR